MSTTPALPDSNQMAMDRTWLSHERTLMSWLRTGVSMISFGFTIYKFFQIDSPKDAPIRRALLTPRDFSLIMVSLGLTCVLLATIQHHRDVRTLRAALQNRRSMAEVIAFLVSVFGLLVLISTILRD